MNLDGIMPLNTSTENRFQYNGKELEKDGGVDLSDYGARWYDASVGRFTSVDPLAAEFAWVSPFNYAENEPVGHIDLWGLQKADPVTVSGGILPDVTVSATNGIHDQSVDRYGYNSDWSQYQHEFGLEGWRYDNAMNYWNSVYADDFVERVAWLDADQKAREDVAMMLQFVRFFEMMSTTVALEGGASPSLPAARGFSLRGFGVKGLSKGGQGGLNLFKWGAPQTIKVIGWKLGDRFLYLPNKGTPKLNWKANSGALRREMGLGKPIFDSYRTTGGVLIPTKGFLNAERSLLQGRGWIYNKGAWLPPGF